MASSSKSVTFHPSSSFERGEYEASSINTIHIAVIGGASLEDRVHLVQYWIGSTDDVLHSVHGYRETYFLCNDTSYHFVVYYDEGYPRDDALIGTFTSVVICINSMSVCDQSEQLCQDIYEANTLGSDNPTVFLVTMHPPTKRCNLGTSSECENKRFVYKHIGHAYSEAMGNIPYFDYFHHCVEQGKPKMNEDIMQRLEESCSDIKENFVTIKQFMEHKVNSDTRSRSLSRSRRLPARSRYTADYLPGYSDYCGNQKPTYTLRFLSKASEHVYVDPTMLRVNPELECKEEIEHHVLHVGVIGQEERVKKLMLLWTGKPFAPEDDYSKVETVTMDRTLTICFYSFHNAEIPPPKEVISAVNLWLFCYDVGHSHQGLYKAMQKAVRAVHEWNGVTAQESQVEDKSTEMYLPYADQFNQRAFSSIDYRTQDVAKPSNLVRSNSIDTYLSHDALFARCATSTVDQTPTKTIPCFVISCDFYEDDAKIKKVTHGEGQELADAMNAMFFLYEDFERAQLIEQDAIFSEAYLNVINNPKSCVVPVNPHELNSKPEFHKKHREDYKNPEKHRNQLMWLDRTPNFKIKLVEMRKFLMKRLHESVQCWKPYALERSRKSNY